jgi:para-nitrobenzyl esterase
MTSQSGLYAVSTLKAHRNRLNLPLDSSLRACLSTLLLLPFFAAVAYAAGAPAHPPVTGPVVHVATGQLRGSLQGTTAIFLGIPFAAPPVGALRWREPQPPIAWSGVRDATKLGSSCVQNPAGIGTFIQPLAAAYGKTYNIVPVAFSEDCLFLNVWAPHWPIQAPLPVMVWVHGGSNRIGSGAEDSYDGAALAARGVLVVTINYRLGPLGFFAHPELAAESPHHSTGNYGLLDQIAALRWVQQNIAQFGGDPANVTVFGESAGSVDVTTLMASPLSANLFRRVIAESGPAFGLGRERNASEMTPLALAVGAAAGGKPGAQLEALRKVPATQVAEIENRLIATRFPGYNPNSPVTDGWVLPQSPARAYASGAIQKVDLLVGLNAREWAAFRVVAEAAQKKSGQPAPKPEFGKQFKLSQDAARPLYGNWTDITVAAYMAKIILHGTPAVDQFTNDVIMACPMGAEAALVTSAGQHAFVYRFERTVPGPGEADLGAFHAIELPYVFNNFQARTFNWLPFTATDHQLSNVIQTYWANFAKTGDPNGPGLPHWERWNTAQEPFIAFGENGEASPQQNFSPMFCHLSPDRLKDQLGSQ